MEEDEILILFVSAVVGLVGMAATRTAGMHRLYFRGNPAPGVVRLGVLLAMGWIFFVLMNFADPSVTGVYVVFYLVMGYAIVKLCGQAMTAAYGLHTRLDAAERRNVPAATVIAAFVLATGLIFGGSLWGEADPVGDDEGGWWIPLSFFLLGWLTLLVAFAMYRGRERGRFAVRLKRERSMADARAAGAFLISAGIALTDAVAGDFWGWRHGIFSFGLLAVLLLVHEAFSLWVRPADPRGDRDVIERRRAIESVAYLLLALVAWTASRYVDTLWGAG